jgi:hypothetical protein
MKLQQGSKEQILTRVREKFLLVFSFAFSFEKVSAGG